MNKRDSMLYLSFFILHSLEFFLLLLLEFGAVPPIDVLVHR